MVFFFFLELMLKCEDALMSSDLFSEEALFMTDISNDPLNLNGDNPFDFLHSVENASSFGREGNYDAQNQQASEFLENPQNLYYMNTSGVTDSNANVTNAKAQQIGNIFENSVNETAADNVNAAGDVLPKITQMSSKDIDMKLTAATAASQQIRNIQPKPETSSYRIVPVKTVNTNTQGNQSSTVTIHNSPSITTPKNVSSREETIIKKVVPFTDLTLLSSSNNNNNKQVETCIYN